MLGAFLEYGRDITEENSDDIYTSALFRCDIDSLRLLLQDKRLKPGVKSLMASLSNIECFKLLLNDERIDPAEENSLVLNQVLTFVNSNATEDNLQALEIINILLEDGRVKENDIVDQIKWKKIHKLLNKI